jgi:hypothetical protein
VISALITGAEGIFTGLPGAAMRAKGAIRIAAGRTAELGELDPPPGVSGGLILRSFVMTLRIVARLVA